MKLTETIMADKEIQRLKVEYYKMFGEHRPFSIWEDGDVETYRNKLKKAIKENKKY